MNVFGSSNTTLGTNGFEVSLNYISGVPDPNILTTCSPQLKLAFKALLKRDETTREKSLSEILQISETPAELDDDLVVLTWVQLYPKLSLDTSKRVRILAHQLQSRFVQVLGKKYSKFLRDTAAVWLAGSFEADRLVAKECQLSLQTAFGAKVDAMWRIFAQYILEFCFQVFKFESKETLSDERFIGKDEAEAKYQRLAYSTLSILATINSKTELNEAQAEKLEEILVLEKLWGCAESSDLQLKRVTFKLATVLAKQLAGKPLKVACKYIVKGLKLKPVPQVIIYSTVIVPMVESLLALTKQDAQTLWDQKKAKARFYELIALGSCNSDSQYYTLVMELVRPGVLPESVLDYSEDGPQLIGYFEENLTREKQRGFIENAWMLYLQAASFASLSVYDVVSARLGDRIPLSAFAILSEKHRDTVQKLHAAIISSLPAGPVVFSKTLSITSYPDLVNNAYVLFKATDDMLVRNLFEAALDRCGDESGANPELSFLILDKALLAGYLRGSKLDDFVQDIPMFIEDKFVELPLRLMATYSSQTTNSKLLHETVNNCYTKITMGDNSETNVALLLKSLHSFKNFDLTKCSDLYAYVEKHSSDVSASTSVDFKFATPEIIGNLYQKSMRLGQVEAFVAQCASDFQPSILEFLTSDPGTDMMVYLWSHSEGVKLLDRLEEYLVRPEVESAYFAGLLGHLKTEGLYADPAPLARRLSPLLKKSPSLIGHLTTDTSLDGVLGENPDLRLFISNSLEGNIMLAQDGASTRNEQAELEFIARMRLVAELHVADPHTKVLVALAAEVAIDHVFLQENSEKLQSYVSDFHIKATAIVLDEVKTDSLSQDVVDSLQGAGDGLIGYVVSCINSECSASRKFYYAKVLKRVLEALADKTSSSAFESLSVSWPKLLKTPFILSVFVSAVPKFLTSGSVERIRNQAASELVGLRGSEILSKGLTNLTVLINFLQFELDTDIPAGFTVAPLNRWVMVVSNLNNWLDSEHAYDPEFLKLRLQLLNFAATYLGRAGRFESSLESLPKFLEFATRLCVDSLGIANVGDSEYPQVVTYWSLKLYLTLNKFSGQNPVWVEEVEALNGEVLEIVKTFTADKHAKDQSYRLVEELISRILDMQLLALDEETLYTLLRSESLELQTVAAKGLSQIILDGQDALVVEYELAKTRLGDSGETTQGPNLPHELLQTITASWDAGLDESEEQKRSHTYLWSWFLVFTHFAKVSQGIRQIYAAELLGNESLTKFFGSIFYWLEGSPVELCDPAEFSPSGTLEERIQELAVVTYYMSLKYTGSAAQSWFNDLRDRNFKAEIEKFTSKHVSPKLIEEQLQSVEDNVERLKETENFSIKINRVTKEVKCFHHIDEQLMELVIALPADYPLSNVSVTGPLRIGVKETQWKAWLLASQYVISVQSGTIVEAIELFNKNVSLHFSGFEECAICYSILHIDHSLPTKSCTTCNNKFHSGCLYKWFKSSGGSTCPLCRSAFSFRIGQK